MRRNKVISATFSFFKNYVNDISVTLKNLNDISVIVKNLNDISVIVKNLNDISVKLKNVNDLSLINLQFIKGFFNNSLLIRNKPSLEISMLCLFGLGQIVNGFLI
jgi:hypothetical protein